MHSWDFILNIENKFLFYLNFQSCLTTNRLFVFLWYELQIAEQKRIAQEQASVKTHPTVVFCASGWSSLAYTWTPDNRLQDQPALSC